MGSAFHVAPRGRRGPRSRATVLITTPSPPGRGCSPRVVRCFAAGTIATIAATASEQGARERRGAQGGAGGGRALPQGCGQVGALRARAADRRGDIIKRHLLRGFIVVLFKNESRVMRALPPPFQEAVHWAAVSSSPFVHVSRPRRIASHSFFCVVRHTVPTTAAPAYPPATVDGYRACPRLLIQRINREYGSGRPPPIGGGGRTAPGSDGTC